MHHPKHLLPIFLAALLPALASCQTWKPADNPLFTPFAADVSPTNAWPEYPRPQMVRDEWLNLNGLWQYHLEPVEFTPVQGLIKQDSMTTAALPDSWDGQILVPFAIDSALSGVKHILRPTERLWYSRSFSIPNAWSSRRTLLHFEAADWETSVYVNGQRIGQHRGGYDPFTFDITSALKPGQNSLAVCCWDATEQQCQAIGKQVTPENRQGFRYQPTGGIWRTVWLEPVHPAAMEDLTLTPDVDNNQLLLSVDTFTASAATLDATVLANGQPVSHATGPADQPLAIPVPNAHLWSPDDPFLYDLTITLTQNDQPVDTVRAYFGMRKIEVKPDARGLNRIFLNDQPIFQLGPLDQGYWPDGILTPPSDAAARYDLQYLKDIGCNMVRVHIKTHPDRWYYWADKLGLLVWQDMICMPKYGQTVDPAASAQWQTEFAAMIDWLENHPSIVHWIVFNEAWSQHDTLRLTNWTMQRDPSRLVTAASGWTDFPVGNIRDEHDYSFYVGTALPQSIPNRAIVFGELGGHNVYIPTHTWLENTDPFTKFSYVDEGGRATFFDGETWTEPYAFFFENLRCLNAAGNNAAVYTQITDVEHECNGWLTYDRKVSKIPADTLRRIHQDFYRPPVLLDLFPDAPQWKVSPARPADSDAWAAPDFDDSAWPSLTLPLTHAPNLAARFDTPNPSLVLRRRFTLDPVPAKAALRIELARIDTGQQPRERLDGFLPRQDKRFVLAVYLNGQLLRKTNISLLSNETGLAFLPLRPEELASLQTRQNTLAILLPDTNQLTSVNLTLLQIHDTQ